MLVSALAQRSKRRSCFLENPGWNGRLDEKCPQEFDVRLNAEKLDVGGAQIGAQESAIGLHLQQTAARAKL